MTQHHAPRLLLSIAMLVALGCSAALWLAQGGQSPNSARSVITLALIPLGVAWAWFSAEGMARWRNRAIANGGTVPEDGKQYGRLLLHSYLALLAFGETILLAQAYGVLSQDLAAIAPRAMAVVSGLVFIIWGDRRAKLTADPFVRSVPHQRRNAWAMALFGVALIPGALFLPPMTLMICFGVAVVGLTVLQLSSRPRKP